MNEYTFKSIAEQAKAIEENQLSPLTLVENYIHNINVTKRFSKFDFKKCESFVLFIL